MSEEINALAEDPVLWHLEDYVEALTEGRRLEGGRYVVTEGEILEFGRRFDPQPMHTDPVAAKDSAFGGLVAPGCLTFAIRNALANQLPVRPALFAGLGLEELRLPRPVRPGAVLSLRIEVVEARRSKSRPETGVVQTRQAVVDQDGETVLTMDARMIVRARAAA
ncbi:MAG: MaoC/PaaZ C-terminal domain-containing protein [Myxococcota bacterium]